MLHEHELGEEQDPRELQTVGSVAGLLLQIACWQVDPVKPALQMHELGPPHVPLPLHTVELDETIPLQINS